MVANRVHNKNRLLIRYTSEVYIILSERPRILSKIVYICVYLIQIFDRIIFFVKNNIF